MIITKNNILTKGWQTHVSRSLNNRYVKLLGSLKLQKFLNNYNNINPIIIIMKNSKYTLVRKNSQFYMQRRHLFPKNTKHDFYIDIKSNIRKFYSTNINSKFDKRFVNIPLGIPPTQLDNISTFLHSDINKDILTYANFNCGVGNFRKYLATILPKMEFVFCHNDIYRGNKLKKQSNYTISKYKECDINEYYECITKSKFVFCPCGHEPNTFRLWETLYLGSIPIVEDIPFFRYFEDDVPMLLVKNFNMLTRDFLEEQYEKIKNKKFPKDYLKLNYWIDNIKNNIKEKNLEYHIQ